MAIEDQGSNVGAGPRVRPPQDEKLERWIAWAISNAAAVEQEFCCSAAESAAVYAELDKFETWVRQLAAQLADLRGERDAAISERESAVRQFQAAERDAQLMQAECDRLKATPCLC